MRVALYARVSTQDQDCERQLRDLRQFAQRRDDQIISTITEQASGSKDDRSGRKEILQLAQAKEVDAILVTELSRCCLLYTSPSPRDKRQSRMPSSA